MQGLEMELLIASTNLHKIREFRQLLAPLNWDILSLQDFPDYTAPEENGKTFEENSLLKGRHARDHFDMWILSDDSGLVVPSLNGEPGIFSGRYAGETASDQENRTKLLHQLKENKINNTSSYFISCISLIHTEKEEKTFTSTCEGFLLDAERGNNGFGYDSLFVKNDYKLTFAELDEKTKLKISPRGKALTKALLFLERHSTA